VRETVETSAVIKDVQATEYLGRKGLVISNMAASVESAMKHVTKVRSQLPNDIRAELDFYENADKTDGPAYQALLFDKVFHGPIQCCAAWEDGIKHVYEVLQGPSEFEATGRTKDWNRWSDLPNIKVRTLTMGARYDEMDPADMRTMAVLLPRGEAWISQTGRHFAMYDDQQNYLKQSYLCLKA
jgi:proline iminopeptidase